MARLAFIGAGRIAQAIMGGLINQGLSASNMTAADPDPDILDMLPTGVKRSADNLAAVADADVVILCVKPNMAKTVVSGLASVLADRLLISVAAGIRASDLTAWSGEATVIRCMPNTPALIRQGMIGLYSADASAVQRALADDLLGAVGATAWFDSDDDLDKVTALSGSGPAYFFYLMEAMIAAGVELGMSTEASRTLVLNTAMGAAAMAVDSPDSPAQLRANVTSPGGTTEAALNVLSAQGLSESLDAAVRAAYERAIELGNSV